MGLLSAILALRGYGRAEQVAYVRLKRGVEQCADADVTRVAFACAGPRGLDVRCLRRSLVLCAMQRRRGAPAVIRLGAARAGDVWQAHAWVECQGAVLGESAAAVARFSRLERPSGASGGQA